MLDIYYWTPGVSRFCLSIPFVLLDCAWLLFSLQLVFVFTFQVCKFSAYQNSTIICLILGKNTLLDYWLFREQFLYGLRCKPHLKIQFLRWLFYKLIMCISNRLRFVYRIHCLWLGTNIQWIHAWNHNEQNCKKLVTLSHKHIKILCALVGFT